MSSVVRWAVLGTGFISHTMIDAVAGSEGSVVSLVAGRDGEKVAEFQATHGIARGTTSFLEAIEDPDINAVYIGLPNHAHHELALAAAAAGKAVLSEKSLTRTMPTAEQLITGLEARDALFVEGLMYLSHPLYRKVVQLLTDGRLGALRSVSGFYAADIAAVVNPAGGGTLYNLGCYPASLLHLVVQTMCGDDAFAERSVTAVGTRDETGNVVDAATSVRFGNGVLATLQSSDTHGMDHAFEVTGTNGTLRWATNPWLPVAGDNVLEWHGHDAPAERIVIADPHDAFHHQVKMMEAAITTGQRQAIRPSPRWSDSLEIMAFLTEWEAAIG